MVQNYFQNRFKELRKKSGLSQKDFGEAIGLSMQAVNDIERGRNKTTLERAILIADFFEISIDYLVGRTDNPKVNK